LHLPSTNVAIQSATRPLGDGAWIALLGRFIANDVGVMERLRASLPLEQKCLRFFGKHVLTPRLVSWHGEPDARYTYSGRTHEPAPCAPELRAVKARVDAAVGLTFTSVLVIFYRDGRASLGEHADEEDGLGPAQDNIVIASVSLGARRRFLLRRKRTRTVEE